MTPEAKIIAINLVLLGYAYFWAYPRLMNLTGTGLLWRDTVLTGVALTIGAFMFAGSGTVFSLVIFETQWFLFQLVSFAVLQTFFFAGYALKNDITF
ncbi:hypothetical protein SAMN04488515_2054 [Cognatiyoonia koreensis]|uniref:Uncharacterized protein n=1 Tax=Cognatiyoonia koreensis TaxID=364200 RepID=A0A1I0QQ74_9RHOB|nr:hypothetical protein [Cognatiyoonia koreensis]SEW28995.1 hypothetical protein SAMN04488515_2054 [Cognatiyoonia koreensis]